MQRMESRCDLNLLRVQANKCSLSNVRISSKRKKQYGVRRPHSLYRSCLIRSSPLVNCLTDMESRAVGVFGDDI